MTRRKWIWGIAVTVAFAGLLLLAACKTESDDPEPAIVTYVHVAGTTVNASDVVQACVWENGVRTDLNSAGKDAYAYSVFFSGVSTYAAGYACTGTNSWAVPCYWKDGSRADLSKSSDAAWGEASSIWVSGADVYVCGSSSFEFGTEVGHFWKNGSRTDLPATTGRTVASGIVVSGSDVFISGILLNPGIAACYWKNAVRMDLAVLNPGALSWGNAIFVSGGDVYVGGDTRKDPATNVPCVWKNGVQTDLSVSAPGKGGWVNSVFVSSGDVYAAGGVVNGANVTVPCYWKNGGRTDLPTIDAGKDGEAWSVFVFQGDVYVVGDSKNGSGIRIPCCWKNGSRTDLSVLDSTKSGYAYSIFVEEH